MSFKHIVKGFSRVLKNRRIYLDYSAGTPVLPEVLRAMKPFWSKKFYNPNGIYAESVEVSREVAKFRRQIAELLNVAEESVIFTSGGAEANVLAVRGVGEGQVVAEPESHSTVTEAILPSTSSEVKLISSLVANNKLGRQLREERRVSGSKYPLLHVDASQSAQYYNVGLETLACDLLTLDSAKMYGPKGIGALVVKRGVTLNLPPLGTPAVPLIAGFAKAFEIVSKDHEAEFTRLSKLSNEFAKQVSTRIKSAVVTQTLPNVINISVPGILPELLVLALDRVGVMVSAGPACSSNKPEPEETPVRFSLGRQTSRKELNQALERLCQVVENLLKLSPNATI